MSIAFDLVVIGSGPGGYVAAAGAASLGLKTAIIEKDSQLGGTCLHRGCIPTKSLLHAADTYSEIREASKIGITVDGVKVDWPAIQKYKQRIVSTNAGGVSHLMKTRKVEVFSGFGKVLSPNKVGVKGSDGKTTEIDTKNILLAVGSTPRALPFAPYNNPRILSSDTVLELDHIPGSLTIIGGGVIGIEFASIFSRFGTKVTILEALPRILAPADADCSKELGIQLEAQGVKFFTEVSVTKIDAKAKAVQIHYSNKKGENSVVDSEYVLVAVGRAPLTNDIGLEKTKAKTDRGFVAVNKFMQSDEPSIYAIGDCVNTPWLAHIASAEGLLAVRHIAKKGPTPINYDHTPSCVYSDPPVAWSGLTEEEAKKRGHDVKVSRFDFMRNAKASILGKKRGFIKFVTDAKYGEILGVHIIGPSATELLAEPAFAMQMEATIDDIAHTIHAHPTLYESIYEAAAIATGNAVHG